MLSCLTTTRPNLSPRTWPVDASRCLPNGTPPKFVTPRHVSLWAKFLAVERLFMRIEDDYFGISKKYHAGVAPGAGNLPIQDGVQGAVA